MGVSCKWPSVIAITLTNCCQISCPANVSAARNPNSTNTVCTSALCAIWPFFRASSSLRGVACSVFSPVCSAMLFPSQHLGYRQQIIRQPVQIINDVLGGQLQRKTKDDQSTHNPKRE